MAQIVHFFGSLLFARKRPAAKSNKLFGNPRMAQCCQDPQQSVYYRKHFSFTLLG